MSDMVQKLEAGIANESYKNARCDYQWFLLNMREVKTVEQDADGPRLIHVTKPWVNQVEIWSRIYKIKGTNYMFEKVGSFPIGADK